jgi:hypothetical protein
MSSGNATPGQLAEEHLLGDQSSPLCNRLRWSSGRLSSSNF